MIRESKEGTIVDIGAKLGQYVVREDSGETWREATLSGYMLVNRQPAFEGDRVARVRGQLVRRVQTRLHDRAQLARRAEASVTEITVNSNKEIEMSNRSFPDKIESYVMTNPFYSIFLVIVVVIIGIGAAELVSQFISPPRIKRHAEAYAKEYVTQVMHLPGARVTCLGKEDDEGYTACTVDTGTSPTPVQISCVANVFIEQNRGCVPYRLRSLDIHNR